MSIGIEAAEEILRMYNVTTFLRQLYSQPVMADTCSHMAALLRIAKSNGWIRYKNGWIHLTPKGRSVSLQIIQGCTASTLVYFNEQWSKIDDMGDVYNDFCVLGAIVTLHRGYLSEEFDKHDLLEAMVGGPLLVPDGKDGYRLTESGVDLALRAEKLRQFMWDGFEQEDRGRYGYKPEANREVKAGVAQPGGASDS